MNELSDKDIFEKAVTRARGNAIARGKKDGISDYEIIIELEREIDYYRERILNFQDVLKRKNIIIAELKEQRERRINDMQNAPAVLEQLSDNAFNGIIKAAAENGYSISINLFKTSDETSDETSEE